MDLRIGNYTLKQCIGKGSFGDVFLTVKDGSSQLFATKRIEKVKAEPLKKYLINEISILKQLNHRNIIKIDDFKMTRNHYYIMFEFCNGGSLGDCLKKYKQMYFRGFPEEYVQYLMRQIVSAVQYLHNNRIIHRDLKLDNILVNFYTEQDKNSLNMLHTELKLIDFDFARYLSQAEFARTCLGSPMNMDPKILNAVNIGSPQVDFYDESVDIWSLGILCYELLIGKAPFFSDTVPGILQNVERGNYSLPLNLSKEVVSFLNGMIRYDNTKRLTANELARHHFLVKNVKEFTPMSLTGEARNARGGQLVENCKQKKTFWGEYSENDELALRNVPANLLTPQQNMNANYYWNNCTNVQNYFTPYNFDFNKVQFIGDGVTKYAKVTTNVTNNNAYGMVYNQASNPYVVNQVVQQPIKQVTVRGIPNNVGNNLNGIINLNPNAGLWG